MTAGDGEGSPAGEPSKTVKSIQTVLSAEPERDGYGRYLIRPPQKPKDKGVAHTRVTTIAGTLEDRYNLEQWANRMVATGLAQRPDLLAGVLSGPESESAVDQKRRLGRICEQAKEHAGASSRANIGTALHAFCAQLDGGKTPIVPAPWDRDVATYQATMREHELTVELSELTCVRWLDYAGTFDRTVCFGSKSYIADIKTGTDLSYSWGSIAIQLALYADAETIYDHDTRSHWPMPDVEKDLGLVIHLPAGEGRCDLYWLDLDKGRAGAAQAVAVRAWRKRKDFHEAWRPDVALSALSVRRARLGARVATIKASGGVGHLATAWPAGVPTFRQSESHTAAQLDLIDDCLIQLESRLGMPFSMPDRSDAKEK